MQNQLCLVKGKEPFEYTLSIMSGKWKLKIIYIRACTSTTRYNVLKRSIEGITHKMLSSQLKELEHEGIIVCKEYPQVHLKWNIPYLKKGKVLYPY